MFLLNGKPLSPDVAFVDINDIQRPANWLRLATPDERAAAGVTEAPDPRPYDQRFAWGYSADGTLLWKDHDQLVEQWSEQTRQTANSLLQPSDWQVIREADNGKEMDAELKQLRQDIRLATGTKVAAINATMTTQELASYVTSSEYSSWPPQTESAGDDTVGFDSGAVSGVF